MGRRHGPRRALRASEVRRHSSCCQSHCRCGNCHTRGGCSREVGQAGELSARPCIALRACTWMNGVCACEHTACVIRRCAPLAAAVRDEAQAWVRGIAQVVAEEDRRQLDELRLQASNWQYIDLRVQQVYCNNHCLNTRPIKLPACANPLKAAELLGEVTVQPLDEPGVDSVRAALAAVRKAGPGVEATCDELEGRVQTRLSLAAPRDVAAMLGELATISDVLASWKKLQQEAAAREEQGVDVLQVTADSPQSGLLSEGSITLQRSNPLSRAPSTASASHVSASSKRRQPKQRSAK